MTRPLSKQPAGEIQELSKRIHRLEQQFARLDADPLRIRITAARVRKWLRQRAPGNGSIQALQDVSRHSPGARPEVAPEPAKPATSVTAAAAQKLESILDVYSGAAPSPQNAIDIFRGQWSSKLPDLDSGPSGLFEDGRITWANERLGGFEGKHVLELGPLEAGHSSMLEKLGAASVTAIEANSRAFLKCLLVKELYGLQRVKFLYGDFSEYLRDHQGHFDACIASGVLYHMRNPVELIQQVSRVCDRLFLWTHYYEGSSISRRAEMQKKFTTKTEAEHQGFKHVLNRYEYQAALDWGGFCGGSASFSNWLSKDDILGSLQHFGFRSVQITHDDLNHPNGPSFSVAAVKN